MDWSKARRLGPFLFLGLIGPCLFLIVPVCYAAWVSAFGSLSAEESLAIVSSDIPTILLGVQIVLAVVALFAAKRAPEAIDSLKRTDGGSAETGIGLAVGAGLGLFFVFVLVPVQTWLQVSFGDYVPPGEAHLALGRGFFIFALANVVIAPIVEEVIYRGALFSMFDRAASRRTAMVMSCVLFGLLHWAGGFWYMGLVTIFAGGTFAWLRIRFDGLLAPIGAHVAMSLIETAKLIS